jgi:hypothetical protein
MRRRIRPDVARQAALGELGELFQAPPDKPPKPELFVREIPPLVGECGCGRMSSSVLSLGACTRCFQAGRDPTLANREIVPHRGVYEAVDDGPEEV